MKRFIVITGSRFRTYLVHECPERMLATMEPTVYLNGAYLPQSRALISANDRGFLFADGVYEVVRYYGGHALSMKQHLERMACSLGELRIELPADAAPFDQVSDELIARNQSPDAFAYWQVSRGVADRDHRFPNPPVTPTIYAFTRPMPPLSHDPPRPMSAITHDEIRWSRCAIKSIALLPNVLARQAAEDAGADEAIFVRHDGTVTEGTARSIFIASAGRLQTYPLDGTVLGSITREIAINLAHSCNIEVVEQPYTIEQLCGADEVIAAGTTTQIRPITRVNGQPIGKGQPGPIALKLAGAFAKHVEQHCLA